VPFIYSSARYFWLATAIALSVSGAYLQRIFAASSGFFEHEFYAFENLSLDNFIVVRQPKKEEYYMEYLEKMGFQPKLHSYLMRNEDDIYEFLTSTIHELAAECELYYSDDFKKISIKSTGKFQAGLRVSNELNLLEMDLKYEEVPSEELKELFKSFRLKKKYYRLKDGSFINFDEENIHEVWDILKSLNISGKDLNNNSIELSKNTALYLDKVFQEKNLLVEKNEEFNTLVNRILNPYVTEYVLPEGIQATLRNYQITGYKWLRTLAENNLGGILADDMGLGKTLQAIVYMASIKQQSSNSRFLIVCPSSLIYNWQDEIDNFAPALTSVVITGNPKERQDMIESDKPYDILITSYPLMRRDSRYYEVIDFHTVFIDEAQFIKNADSLNAKSVKLLHAGHKFALTGTPIENSLSELWSIFDFIMPEYLLSHTKFVNQYEKPIMKEQEGTLEDLNRRITPFILRRMKKDVLHELPEKVETKMLTDMVEEQKKVYLSYMENIKNELQSDINEIGLEKSKMKILAALTRLRQICCHPGTFIENYQGGSGKLELLMEIITDAISNEHRILIFSQFTSMLSIIEKELKKLNITGFYLEGSTKIQDRNEYVKRFNQGEGDVFLISLKAGGTGLNLVGADTVIHYDPWWNPAVEEQATDRAYRIGQLNSVHVIKLITKGTIEEKIYKLQLKKKNLSNSVIHSKEVFINTLSKEELEDIFS
jgi:SNF2 family DNA or RNA helicase